MAFESYSRTTKEERLALLDNLLRVTKDGLEEMAQAMTAEMGAPISMSRDAQADSGVGHLEGFIDALIKTKDSKGKEVYWVIDWKTAGDKGWYASKRRDILTWAQIALYKHFWRNKNKAAEKIKAYFAMSIYIIFLLGFNLGVAHYRAALEISPDSAIEQAIIKSSL